MLCLVGKGICTLDLPGWPQFVISPFIVQYSLFPLSHYQKTDETSALRCFSDARWRESPKWTAVHSVRKNGSREEETMCGGTERLQVRELGKDSRDMNSKILTLSDYLIFLSNSNCLSITLLSVKLALCLSKKICFF